MYLLENNDVMKRNDSNKQKTYETMKLSDNVNNNKNRCVLMSDV